MAFEATKREWGELYAFFRLLADGYVYAGTPDVKRNEVQKLPVAMVQREEHDGTRRYILEDEATVRICGEKIDKQIPRGILRLWQSWFLLLSKRAERMM